MSRSVRPAASQPWRHEATKGWFAATWRADSTFVPSLTAQPPPTNGTAATRHDG